MLKIENNDGIIINKRIELFENRIVCLEKKVGGRLNLGIETETLESRIYRFSSAYRNTGNTCRCHSRGFVEFFLS